MATNSRNDYFDPSMNRSENVSYEYTAGKSYGISGADIPSGFVSSPAQPSDIGGGAPSMPNGYTPTNAASAPAPGNFGNYPPTNPVGNDAQDAGSFGATQIVSDPGNVHSMKLVTGWLVAIEGPCKGKDFRLHAGWNYIGRDIALDVNLGEDMSVSRQRVVKVDYDPISRTFGVSPCDGTKSLSYLNGKPLRGDRDFEAYDRLKVGESELILIPFCSDKFAWEDQEKEEEKK